MTHPAPRPNIILLVGEDAGRAAGCYGDTDALTPHLDRLAAEGCLFGRAFSTAPVCAPSRSALVTGRPAWTIGSHHMRSKLLAPPPLFTHGLRAAGYHVRWPTKTDFNFTPPADFADATTDWLDELRDSRLPDQPFFLFKNFALTHESSLWAEPFQGRGAGLERGLADGSLPSFARTDPTTVRVPSYLPDTPAVRAEIARFYDALAHVDHQVGEVLTVLDASPHRDNTLVIYITDHGRGLVREKRWCYAAGIHLSCLARWPAHLTPGSVNADLVSWIDFAPTVLALAGATSPSPLPGRVLFGPAVQPAPDFIFAGRDRMDETFDRVRAARSDDFHYIRNHHPNLPWAQPIAYMEHGKTTQAVRDLAAGGKITPWMHPTKPPEELYHAATDPDMVHNLAADPAYASTLNRHRAALDAHLAAHGDLGAVPEREHIARGLVADVLTTDYALRIASLPDHQSPHIYHARLTAED